MEYLNYDTVHRISPTRTVSFLQSRYFSVTAPNTRAVCINANATSRLFCPLCLQLGICSRFHSLLFHSLDILRHSGTKLFNLGRNKLGRDRYLSGFTALMRRRYRRLDSRNEPRRPQNWYRRSELFEILEIRCIDLYRMESICLAW